MKSSRSMLLISSMLVVVVLVAGGLAFRVGAGESSYHQVVVFGEVLSLVIDNYVDPVDTEELLLGAYEGMLAGLDPNGAYLTPGEVSAWKGLSTNTAGPGISVLKSGRGLQVVSVSDPSPAADAGIEVGDHIRAVDGVGIRELSLEQAWRRLQGPIGSSVRIDILHPGDGFKRETIELERKARRDDAYTLDVASGIAVLRVHDMQRLDTDDLVGEMDDVRSRGVSTLLLDLRNSADLRPREVEQVASLFSDGTMFHLRDRSGRLVESIDSGREQPGWAGDVAVLVNGATAGSAEALALLIQAERGGLVLGETTYGLGAEVKLYELDDGSGLLISAALWETASGGQWNGEGVEPDEIVRGRGADFATASADQLERVLELLGERMREASRDEREAA